MLRACEGAWCRPGTSEIDLFETSLLKRFSISFNPVPPFMASVVPLRVKKRLLVGLLVLEDSAFTSTVEEKKGSAC